VYPRDIAVPGYQIFIREKLNFVIAGLWIDLGKIFLPFRFCRRDLLE
jgi:hypothetical protein